MTRAVFVAPEQWRHLLRASLRECSYLPDPIARGYMHDHILERYRHHVSKHRNNAAFPVPMQFRLRRTARHALSLLKRANEGYLRPLERVLLLSYGRIGKRRHQLLEPFLTPEVLPDAGAVADMIKQPSMFEGGWQPPAIVVELLKSQQRNGLIGQSGVRSQIKTVRPKIPEENAWGRPLALCRRRNIRKKWYEAAINSLLPPLPEAEAKILEGLLSGTQPWAPVKRRRSNLEPPSSAQSLDAKFLAEGPSKGHSFEKFANGRPHRITRRFMRRTWKRISCLIPQVESDATNKKMFKWDLPNRDRKMSMAIDKEQSSVLFAGLDPEGKLIITSPRRASSQC